MQKVEGIKSVDFKITALGHGVVNWNGSTKVKIWDAMKNKFRDVDNHSMPKLRGYTNIEGEWEDGNPKYKQPSQIDFKKTPLYISQNCIRHHLFKNEPYNLQSPKLIEEPDKLLCSLTGLVRGYVIPKNENKRTSPLLLTDFVDLLGNGNFEQMGQSGSKEKQKSKSGKETSNAIFSKTTFGDTKYEAYGSISIELLQFIPLCADFGRRAMIINNDSEGKDLAKKIEDFIKKLGHSEKITATYHKNYVRKGSIYNEGEQGILLNDEAIDVLVDKTIELFKNLTIRQAKGYMYVDSIEIDYNNGVGKDMMRIRKGGITEPVKKEPYAVYFEGV
jgi:hypothetical protein